MTSKKYRYAFIVLPTFSLFPYVSAIEVLRMANQILDRKVYEWEIVNFREGGKIEASCGLGFYPKFINPSEALDYSAVFVCGGISIKEACTPLMLGGLQKLSKQDITLGSFSTGSYVLARAGVLNGYQWTIHWDRIAATREEFPSLRIRDDIYVIDRDRYTCAGGSAAIDMMLELIREQQGEALASSISDQFLIDRVRTPQDHQRIPLRHQLGTNQPKLTEVAKLMSSNIEEPLSIGDLADYVEISKRQLERLFKQNLGITPTQYYISLRLKSARRLLVQTEKSIIDISFSCGFSSAAHFSRCYRRMFGSTPRDDRKKLSVNSRRYTC